MNFCRHHSRNLRMQYTPKLHTGELHLFVVVMETNETQLPPRPCPLKRRRSWARPLSVTQVHYEPPKYTHQMRPFPTRYSLVLPLIWRDKRSKPCPRGLLHISQPKKSDHRGGLQWYWTLTMRTGVMTWYLMLPSRCLSWGTRTQIQESSSGYIIRYRHLHRFGGLEHSRLWLRWLIGVLQHHTARPGGQKQKRT